MRRVLKVVFRDDLIHTFEQHPNPTPYSGLKTWRIKVYPTECDYEAFDMLAITVSCLIRAILTGRASVEACQALACDRETQRR